MSDEKNEVVISKEELEVLRNLKINVVMANSVAEKAAAESKLAESERQNAIYRIYLKYGLAVTDSFDEVTGKVTRKSSEEKENLS